MKDLNAESKKKSRDKMINPVIIFGASLSGKLALDVFTSNDVVVYGFLDDDKTLHQKEIGEITVLGHTEDDGFLKLIGKKCDAFVAVESRKERNFLTEMLKERRHIVPINAIHKDCSISKYAAIGHGNLLASGCRIASFAAIGTGNLLHSNTVVEVEAKIGDNTIIGSGSIIGTGAEISDGVFIGPGVTILSGIKIGKGASVGAGSVVLTDIAASAKVFGYPAKPA